MVTTAVFAEILVIGLQVEAWLGLALVSAFGTGWIDLGEAQGFAALVTFLVLALAYVLGIVSDRLADTLVDRFENTEAGLALKGRFSKASDGDKPERISAMRMRVMHESEGMTRFLDYQRSRWRIARATVVNLAIATPLAALYLVVGTDESPLWALAPLVAGLALIPVVYFAAIRIQDAWVGRLVDAHAIVTEGIGTSPPRPDSRAIVAAVCHRQADGAPELLLVRTKGGKHWTFPKGHVRRGEQPRAAAAREATEEAGVEGEVADTPFTRYRYPDTRGGGGESLVSAFLLAVTRQRAPDEPRREPTWVPPEEAIRLLGAGDRETEYAEEHARVVREAVAALGR